MNTEQQQLAAENINLVYDVWHRYFQTNTPEKYESDFIEEGMIGLCKAAKKYDPNKDVKFSTYAHRCIKNSMGRILQDWQTKKRKGTEISLFTPIFKHKQELHTMRIIDTINGNDPGFEEVEHLDEIRSQKEFVKWMLSALNDDEVTVLSLRYGLGGMEPKKYREIGEIYGVSGQAIAKRLDKMKEKLRKRHADQWRRFKGGE